MRFRVLRQDLSFLDEVDLDIEILHCDSVTQIPIKPIGLFDSKTRQDRFRLKCVIISPVLTLILSLTVQLFIYSCIRLLNCSTRVHF